MYNRKTRADYLNPIITFTIWPFLSLILSLRNRKKFWAKNICWLFCVYFGFTFIINNENVDSFRYAQWFISLHSLDTNLINFLGTLYSENTNYIDILQPLLSFILSRFTVNPHFLYASFGLVFGYFYVNNIWILFERLPTKKSIITSVFVTTFMLIIPIWQINGFRFWTAAQIFLFGVFSYLLEGNRKKIWISTISFFVHFTFIIPIMVLLIYAYLGNRKSLYFILFIITIFINEVNLEVIKQLMSYLPAIFQNKSTIYLQPDAIENQNLFLNANNWYIRYYVLIIKWISYFFLIVLYFSKKIISTDSKLVFERLYSFSLIFYAFANIANLMPQGGRFFDVANMFVFFVLALIPIMIHETIIIKSLKVLSLPFLILIIIVSLRIGSDYIGFQTLFGNPLSSLFIEGDVPLINLLK